jgi:hypothetical protein
MNKRRGFIGGLLALPFAGKAAAAVAPQVAKPFDVQAAKRAWREYVWRCEKVATEALWQGKDFQQAMDEVAEFKRLNPPPPYAKPKDRLAVVEALHV